MIRTNLHLAMASIRGAKLRTFLTTVAVIIGIASFTVVTTMVDGLQSAATSEIDGYGGNLITVVPGKVLIENENGDTELNFAAASLGTSTITEKDVKDIAAIDEVVAIAPLSFVGAQVSRNDTVIEDAAIIATSPDYPVAFSQEVTQGTFLQESELKGNFAVVGQGIVEELYGGELSLGTQVVIRGQEFTVIGAMEPYETALGAISPVDLDKSVFISLDNGKELNAGTLLIQEVDLQLDPEADAEAVKDRIHDTLLANHGGEEDFTVLTQDELIELSSSIFGVIKQAGQFLSGVMLFVSSIVILLIMLVTVRERTREIGIRKSIGATNVNILTQFMAEAVVISWVGSFIGLIIGAIVGLIAKNATDITPAYSLNTLVVLVVISTTVGVLAGVIPAAMAARRDPIESLRHE